MSTWTAAAVSWEPIVGLYLLCVLVGGWALNRGLHRETAPAPGWRWSGDRWERTLVLLIVGVAILQLWFVVLAPVKPDEANQFEPGFWGQWFLGPESSAFPPLFRFVIHLTATSPDRLWLMRLSALLPGLAVLWLLFRMLRQRTDGWLALLLTAGVAFQPTLFNQTHMQKAYPLMLLLLLAAQRSFERALGGQRRQWARYALWSSLATLTHYLVVPYLFGHAVYVAWRRPREIRRVILAGAPAALCLLPFLWPLSAQALPRDVGALGLAGVWPWIQPWTTLLFSSGGVAVLLLWPTLKQPSSRTPDEWAVLTPLILGAGVMLAFGLKMQIAARYFYPVLPLLTLVIATRCPRRWRDWRPALRWTAIGLLGVGGLFALANIAVRVDVTLAPSLRRQLELPQRPAVMKSSRTVLVYPAYLAEVLVFELGGHRCVDHCHVGRDDDGRVYRLGRLTVRGLHRPGLALLRREAARGVDFDLLVLEGKSPVFGEPRLRRWLEQRCRSRVSWRSLLGPDMRRYRCRARRGGSQQ